MPTPARLMDQVRNRLRALKRAYSTEIESVIHETESATITIIARPGSFNA